MVKIKKGEGSKKKIKDKSEIVEAKPSRDLELWEPFRDMLSFRDSMDEMFRSFFGMLPSKWKPKVDVHETKSDILVTTSLPGVEPDDIEVEVTDDSVAIKGERKHDKEVKDEDYYLRERAYGSFSRCFTLPKEINVNKVEASFDKGVLKIKLPKKRPSKAKSIKIKPS